MASLLLRASPESSRPSQLKSIFTLMSFRVLVGSRWRNALKSVLLTKVGAGSKESNKECYRVFKINSSMELLPAIALKEREGAVIIIQRKRSYNDGELAKRRCTL